MKNTKINVIREKLKLGKWKEEVIVTLFNEE